LLVLCLILLLLLVVVAFPPIVQPILDLVIPATVIRPEKLVWKEWLSYLKILFEVLVAVTVSGSVFGESIKAGMLDTLEDYQRVRELVLRGDVRALNGKVKKLALRSCSPAMDRELKKNGQVSGHRQVYFRVSKKCCRATRVTVQTLFD
jgi:energy-coupling factor transporter transmembrane protein EcfT